MPHSIMIPRTLFLAVSPNPRSSSVALLAIARRTLSPTCRYNSRYNPSDFTTQGYSTQGYSGTHYPDAPMQGPLAGASAPRHPTPRQLKEILDRCVVGQDYAKKVFSTAVYGHHLRIEQLDKQREIDRRKQREMDAKRRRELSDRWNRGEYIQSGEPQSDEAQSEQDIEAVTPSSPESIPSTTHLQIEKSNLLMLGPTGVGKTLMTKTLARYLGVPYSTSDCTAFTQSGYVGEDAESCVARLLAAANYDVEAAERGIIVLDEIDKIAGVKIAHGKDIGGEGVQQSLLKIIEGTTLQIQAKAERGNTAATNNYSKPRSSDSSWSGGSNATPPTGKGEIYNVKTDNILFICTGAFVGLEKLILNRKAKGGLGFGAQVRSSDANKHDTVLSDADVANFSKDTPIYIPVETENSPRGHTRNNQYREEQYNILNYVEPTDLQKYGMIPELVGRIPKICAVSSLDEEALVRVLTEPENSLIEQEQRLFLADGIQLYFTSASLREIAARARNMGTGARGLKAMVERVLLDCKFETPGSSIKHILVTREAAQLKRAPLLFAKGQSQTFETMYKQEEDEWLQAKELHANDSIGSFVKYREAGAAGG